MDRRLLDAFFRPYRFVAKRFPKKDGLVLFGARRGLWYTDCSRQVYEWLLENQPEVEPVWITNNQKVYQRMRDQGLPVVRRRSFKAFYLMMRSRLAVTSAQLYDITSVPESVPDSLRVVFLGHGKSVKASSLAFNGGTDPDFRDLFNRAVEVTDVAVSTSPFVTGLSSKSNAIPEDRYVVTGYPRNDELVRPSKKIRRRWEEYLAGLKPRMTILYAPTWRKDDAPTRFFPFDDFDPDALQAFLKENKILLLVRPHERDLIDHKDLRGFLETLAEGQPWIRVCDPDAFDHVNHVLPFVDVLISDYSSIYNDFLLCDRPMVFIPYDYEEFAKTQGFMFDYFEHLPGPPVSTQEGFLQELRDIQEGRDPYRDERHRLRDMIHTHTDGRSTQRVTQLILDRLGTDGGEPGATRTAARVATARPTGLPGRNSSHD